MVTLPTWAAASDMDRNAIINGERIMKMIEYVEQRWQGRIQDLSIGGRADINHEKISILISILWI
jgi:hypothetical protein